MLFSEMQQMFQDILASPTSSVFSSTLIKSLLNLSARHLYNKIVDARELHFLTSGLISWVSGTELYNLPNSGSIAKIVLVERLDLQQKVNLNFIDITQKNEYQNQLDILIQPRTVVFYAGNQIGFAPIPSQSATNNINIYYVPEYTDMAADGDTLPPAWPTDYHEVVVWGAIKRGAVRIKEEQDLYASIYAELEAQLIAMVAARQVQEAHFIEAPPDGGQD